MKREKFVILLFVCSLIFVSAIFLAFTSKDQLDFSYEIGVNPNRINEVIHTYSIKDYQNELEKIKNETNRNFIFPETISDKVVCNGFSYLEDVVILDWGDDCRAEIYFSMRYSEDEYIREIDRISSITNQRNSKKKPVLSKDLFNLPAYIAIYNHYSRYEYVLLNEDEHEVIYIYLFDCGKDNFCFPVEYIPSKVLSSSDFPKNLISSSGDYDMYYF